MDRYQRVEKARAETPISENEMRITTQGRMRNYITYATTLLQEKGSNEIVLKAMGRAINKTVMIVELIKRRIVGLHQMTTIGSTHITDVWEPLEEGLNTLETTRHVSMITITLSKKQLDNSSVGYQQPLPPDQVQPANEYDYVGDGEAGRRGKPRNGRGNGPYRGNDDAVGEYEDGGWERGRGYGRGRGRRGRGRNYGGRRGGRGGAYEETNDYNAPHEGQGQGRERARGNGRARGRGRGRGDEPVPNGLSNGHAADHSSS